MKRQKTDPLSLLISLKRKNAATTPLPLVSIPPEEAAAFQALRQILGGGKLFAYLDKKEMTDHGERAVCINENLLAQVYPGLNPLTDSLPPFDSFIYVYEGVSGRDGILSANRGDLRQYLGELGFRQLLLELSRSCQIHQFCASHLRPNLVVIEPITGKATIEARRDALAIQARAREVFHQIAERIGAEIATSDADAPPVIAAAHRFACEMAAILSPLAWAGKRMRTS
jgi:hypothetical protein